MQQLNPIFKTPDPFLSESLQFVEDMENVEVWSRDLNTVSKRKHSVEKWDSARKKDATVYNNPNIYKPQQQQQVLQSPDVNFLKNVKHYLMDEEMQHDMEEEKGPIVQQQQQLHDRVMNIVQQKQHSFNSNHHARPNSVPANFKRTSINMSQAKRTNNSNGGAQFKPVELRQLISTVLTQTKAENMLIQEAKQRAQSVSATRRRNATPTPSIATKKQTPKKKVRFDLNAISLQYANDEPEVPIQPQQQQPRIPSFSTPLYPKTIAFSTNKNIVTSADDEFDAAIRSGLDRLAKLKACLK